MPTREKGILRAARRPSVLLSRQGTVCRAGQLSRLRVYHSAILSKRDSGPEAGPTRFRNDHGTKRRDGPDRPESRQGLPPMRSVDYHLRVAQAQAKGVARYHTWRFSHAMSPSWPEVGDCFDASMC